MWSDLKSWLHGLVDRVATAAWSAAFMLAGRVSRRPVRRWTPIGGGRILAIAPHPDDECTGCGGTLARHVTLGDEVLVLQVTDGGASRAAVGVDPSEMARRRASEARAAAALLGVTLESCGLPETEWVEQDLIAILRARLTSMNPDVVYAPSCIDFHPDHVRVARALAGALDGGRETPVVRVYEISVPLGPALTTCVSDTSDAVGIQDAALASYPSQSGSLRATKRLRRYWARFYGARRSAEVFWEMRPREYQALLARGDWLGSRSWSRDIVPYRSLRTLAVSDGAAFYCGARTRRALRRAIDGLAAPGSTSCAVTRSTKSVP